MVSGPQLRVEDTCACVYPRWRECYSQQSHMSLLRARRRRIQPSTGRPFRKPQCDLHMLTMLQYSQIRNNSNQARLEFMIPYHQCIRLIFALTSDNIINDTFGVAWYRQLISYESIPFARGIRIFPVVAVVSTSTMLQILRSRTTFSDFYSSNFQKQALYNVHVHINDCI